MKLQSTIDDINTLEEPFRDLYVLRDGKYHFDGVDGIKTQADIDRLQSSLGKERDAHKQMRDKFAPIIDKDPNEILSILDRVPELEAAAQGANDPEKIQALVDAKLNAVKAPLERELSTVKKTKEELETQFHELTKEKLSRAIHDSVIKEVRKAKIPVEVDEDILLNADRIFEVVDGQIQTKDGVGVTPGIDPATWLTEVLPRKPHWRGPSFGGGARGSQGGGNYGTNPWTAKDWNKTEQGKIYREDSQKAEQMAKSAGTTVAGGRPKGSA